MKFKDIKKGELISTTMYLKVLSKGADYVEVEDNSGKVFKVVGPNLLEKGFKSAVQFSKTEKVSRTQLAEIFTNLGDQVFQVDFVKQDGNPRTLIGYKLSTENLMGRVNAVDLEVKTGHNQRQIDLRTINQLIANDVKYSVK